nr:hypothetical protein [Tanacetum cinerariifolium]
MLQDVKSYLGRCFAMKDLGEAAYILGIKIYRDRSKRLISLCQSAYIEKIKKDIYGEFQTWNYPNARKVEIECTHLVVAFAQNITSRFQQNPGAVDSKSTKQSNFATLSTDAEYIATFDASKEAVWIQKFISGLGVVPTIEEPISMYCDNTSAIAIAKDYRITKGEASEDDDGVLDMPSLELRFWFCMSNKAYPKYGYNVLKV